MAGLTIGRVAAEAGVGVETVRFYERRNLLEPPPRNAHGHRLYPAEAVRQTRFIQRGQELGFTLAELGELLGLRVSSRASCGDVRARAVAKIAAIDHKLVSLSRVREALAALVAACDGGLEQVGCPILEALDEAP